MIKRLFGFLIAGIILTLAVAVLFIKFDTSAAADFTDNVLRPILGANNVVFLEKMFFNTSDAVRRASSKNEVVTAPQFNDNLQGTEVETKGLIMATIPTEGTFVKLKGEGVWSLTDLKAFPNEGVMAHTFVRPDSDRSYAVVTIAQLDMQKMNLGVVAGIKEPAGKVGNPGSGKVPSYIVDDNRLVAAFDGGFQYRDGEFGMIVDGKTYLPLKNNLGTVVGYRDGSFKIIDYIGQDLGENVAFVRQNCPILVINGQNGVEDMKNKKLWGRTPTTAIYTWRTALGIMKNGNLLFGVGNSLTPATLAKAMMMAGAMDAIQLDINPNWVRFNIFNPLGDGKYDSKPLTHDLKDGSISYLTGYAKDFFYVYKK